MCKECIPHVDVIVIAPSPGEGILITEFLANPKDLFLSISVIAYVPPENLDRQQQPYLPAL